MALFADRFAAGRALAARLTDAGVADPVVLALPRGGVPVALEIAQALGAPFGIVVARKIPAPGRPELGVGAVTAAGPPLFDEELLRMCGISAASLAEAVDLARAEAVRRSAAYGVAEPAVTGRTAVVVDDGVATGVTARAALRSLAARRPARLLLATPVASPRALAGLSAEAEVVCLAAPEGFRAVQPYYDDFGQLSDADVLDAIARYQRGP